jgi:hypothetical protein
VPASAEPWLPRHGLRVIVGDHGGQLPAERPLVRMETLGVRPSRGKIKSGLAGHAAHPASPGQPGACAPRSTGNARSSHTATPKT